MNEISSRTCRTCKVHRVCVGHYKLNRLDQCSKLVHGVYYVIAHEFAHAYLRNGGWGEILDREEAADALAAHWGFPRPAGPFPR